MSDIKPVEKLGGVEDYPVNFYHITDAFLMQKINSFRFTSKAKTKAEVNMTGAKWFRQKGTGRARQGEMSNPHMKGGGKAHGPHPRYSPNKLNKRVRRSAWLSALAYHFGRSTLFVVDDAAVTDMWKTREAAGLLDSAGLFDRTLICCSGDSPLNRSVRNIANVAVLPPDRLNIRDMMLAEYIVFTSSALKEVELRATAMRSATVVRRDALNLAAADLLSAVANTEPDKEDANE
jgi:large subunit ribosomal protein L4